MAKKKKTVIEVKLFVVIRDGQIHIWVDNRMKQQSALYGCMIHC